VVQNTVVQGITGKVEYPPFLLIYSGHCFSKGYMSNAFDFAQNLIQNSLPDLFVQTLTDPEVQDAILEIEQEAFARKSLLGREHGGIVNKGELIDWLTEKVRVLRTTTFPGEAPWVSRIPLRVAIIKANHFPNAFSAPWGTLYFNTPLLKRVPSEGSLMGIVAHEIVHFELMHFARDCRFLVAVLAALLEMRALKGERFAVVEESIENVLDGFLSTRSHEQEFEADAGAIQAMAEHGYPLAALPEALQVITTLNPDEQKYFDWLKRRQKQARSGKRLVVKGRLLESLTAMAYSTHPETPERVKRLKQLAVDIRADAAKNGTSHTLELQGIGRQFLDRLLQNEGL
jgi:Zn-dependent protease with chaperone function